MKRQFGFRFSSTDAAILLTAAVVATWVHQRAYELWWVVPMAIGHFFLFCNVFLVWRCWELIWAGSFVVNVLLHMVQGHLNFWPIMGWQLPATLLVIYLQIRSPWYHGIFARQLNPRLQEYLDGHL
ncbi:hypothetical protein [Prosthecobacter dejongeii]|uniref:Uncharacterized protein n=1 Tax=Prosthecobacter dejongeii TaxID=48465 RepID=A0A7W8DP41_9BACT|nr:hypothetical protein [Prosthecobacter dejongeii]MBB5036561.1 hypothetical protein [Prosthecobacter dejongeii]